MNKKNTVLYIIMFLVVFFLVGCKRKQIKPTPDKKQEEVVIPTPTPDPTLEQKEEIEKTMKQIDEKIETENIVFLTNIKEDIGRVVTKAKIKPNKILKKGLYSFYLEKEVEDIKIYFLNEQSEIKRQEDANIKGFETIYDDNLNMVILITNIELLQLPTLDNYKDFVKENRYKVVETVQQSKLKDIKITISYKDDNDATQTQTWIIKESTNLNGLPKQFIEKLKEENKQRHYVLAKEIDYNTRLYSDTNIVLDFVEEEKELEIYLENENKLYKKINVQSLTTIAKLKEMLDFNEDTFYILDHAFYDFQLRIIIPNTNNLIVYDKIMLKAFPKEDFAKLDIVSDDEKLFSSKILYLAKGSLLPDFKNANLKSIKNEGLIININDFRIFTDTKIYIETKEWLSDEKIKTITFNFENLNKALDEKFSDKISIKTNPNGFLPIVFKESNINDIIKAIGVLAQKSLDLEETQSFENSYVNFTVANIYETSDIDKKPIDFSLPFKKDCELSFEIYQDSKVDELEETNLNEVSIVNGVALLSGFTTKIKGKFPKSVQKVIWSPVLKFTKYEDYFDRKGVEIVFPNYSTLNQNILPLLDYDRNNKTLTQKNNVVVTIKNKTFYAVRDDVEKASFKDVKEIESLAFLDMPNLKTVVIKSNSKLRIKQNTFCNLPTLERVIFNCDVVLEKDAFNNCPNLKNIYFSSEAQIETDAFNQTTPSEIYFANKKPNINLNVFKEFNELTLYVKEEYKNNMYTQYIKENKQAITKYFN